MDGLQIKRYKKIITLLKEGKHPEIITIIFLWLYNYNHIITFLITVFLVIGEEYGIEEEKYNILKKKKKKMTRKKRSKK